MPVLLTHACPMLCFSKSLGNAANCCKASVQLKNSYLSERYGCTLCTYGAGSRKLPLFHADDLELAQPQHPILWCRPTKTCMQLKTHAKHLLMQTAACQPTCTACTITNSSVCSHSWCVLPEPAAPTSALHFYVQSTALSRSPATRTPYFQQLHSSSSNVIMGGGRVIQVATKEQWDKVMAENAGKAVSTTGQAKGQIC